MGIISAVDGTIDNCPCCGGGGGGGCDSCAACEYCACTCGEDIECTCAGCFPGEDFPVGCQQDCNSADCGADCAGCPGCSPANCDCYDETLDFDCDGDNDFFDFAWYDGHACVGCD